MMEQTWRWFGPDDPVTINDIRQTGATGIVTALHHIPNGEVWTVEQIQQRCHEIEFSHGHPTGLHWSVVESVPVTEAIKLRTGDYLRHIEQYQETLENLSKCGIKTVCYNFMPVLDWTRTDLAFEMPDGSKALRFDAVDFSAFDLFILKRPESKLDYSPQLYDEAHRRFSSFSPESIKRLTDNIIAGLPGSEEGYTVHQLQKAIDQYQQISSEQLKEHLAFFLQQVIPTAQQYGIRMAIHPDDPPWSLLGLPRIASTEADLSDIIDMADSPANGITLCCGSLGPRKGIDLAGLAQRLGHRINFVHLRNTSLEADQRSFYEADHLKGDHDMFPIVRNLLLEQLRRKQEGRCDHCIPMRPDHGHQILDDINKKTNPGYSCIGRMKGLAELRGLMTGIEQSLTMSDAR
ncbi:MAG: mannonate dehydratase [Endozoicomonas sp.]|uniref:mannonate dehydratase n=1 Tax=Endozoicomonas sp. TaxID=1892382 RepID=UPI003D9BEDE7